MVPVDLAASLRRQYPTFLAVLVSGVILIIALGGTSPAAALSVDCALGVAGLMSGWAWAPARDRVPAPAGGRAGTRIARRRARSGGGVRPRRRGRGGRGGYEDTPRAM